MSDDQISNVDPHLMAFVHGMNAGDGEVGITLLASGGVVTGNLVSAAKWWHLHAELFASNSMTALAEMYEDLSSGSRVDQAVPDSRLEGDDAPTTLLPAHIHLINARYMFGTSMIPTPPEGMLWRGRLSEISGWSLGMMNIAT